MRSGRVIHYGATTTVIEIIVIIIPWRWLRSGISLLLSITVEFLQPFGFTIYFLLFFFRAAFFFFEHAFYALGFCRFGFFTGALCGFELVSEAGGFGVEFPLGAGVGGWGAGGGLGGVGGVGEGGLVVAAGWEGGIGVRV